MSIPVNEPLLSGNVSKYVNDCISAGWISSEGPYVEAFERAWADYCGMPFGVAVSNGTTALQIAMKCAGFPPGGEVIMPSFTIISCAIAILEAGLVPVLVDVEADTWCLDPAQVEARITERTVAIMPVHMYGHPADVDAIARIAAKHGLFVIEDAAEAHGASVDRRRTGSFGDVSCFSFYANKIITTGEGGMVLAKSEQHRDRLRAARNLAFRPERRFLHTEIGHNYRLTSVQAAIGLAQVEQIDTHVSLKRRVGKWYTELLSDLDLIQLPVERSGCTNVYWMYGVVLGDDVPIDAAECSARMLERGIHTRPFFVGMHEQPVFQQMGLFAGERYPLSERLASRGFYLPSGLTLTESQVSQSAEALRDVLLAL